MFNLKKQNDMKKYMCTPCGWIYDPEGIDVELLKEVKEVRRERLTAYADASKLLVE